MRNRIGRRRFLFGSAAVAATAPGAKPVAASPGKSGWEPRLAENIQSLDEATLRWMVQLGLKWVDLQGTDEVDRDGKGWWSVADVQAAQQRCGQFGLKLACMTIPIARQMKSLMGLPGRDQEIDYMQRSICSMGQVGVPVFQCRSSPDFKWGREMGYSTVEGRGGAGYTAFDYGLVKAEPPFPDVGAISYEELWGRVTYMVKPLAEAAEQAGIRISVHPKDPPQPVVRGVARLFTNIRQIEDFLDAIPSPANGFTFCQGTVTEMGVDVIDAIRRLGARKKIHHVHFRAVRGRVPKYVETFIDEGDVDMLAAMRAYRDVGYEGAIVSDHTPRVTGDLPGGKVGRSFSHGYIRALVQAVNAES